MNHSDIFDRFVKIAEKQGLIEPYKPEHTEKDFSETNPRMDSLSIEQISKLYNNKPCTPKDMEYKKNIMEDAHPDSLVISTSHDKLNGLIENEIEGQNIRLRIVNKQPTGHLDQFKYAEKQLILSLVRTANDLDRDNQDKLYKLADVCLDQAANPKRKIKKVAQVLLLIGAISAGVGLLYAKEHMEMHNDGFAIDYQEVSDKINTILNSNSNMGVGYTYSPGLIAIVTKLQGYLEILNNKVSNIISLVSEINSPKTGAELAQVIKSSAGQEAAKAIPEFQALVSNINPYLNKVIMNFKQPSFKQKAIIDKGFLTSTIDSFEVLRGSNALMTDDLDKLSLALSTLKKNILAIVGDLVKSQSIAQDAKKQLETSNSEVKSATNPDKPTDGGQTAQKPEPGSAEADIADIGKELVGF